MAAPDRGMWPTGNPLQTLDDAGFDLLGLGTVVEQDQLPTRGPVHPVDDVLGGAPEQLVDHLAGAILVTAPDSGPKSGLPRPASGPARRSPSNVPSVDTTAAATMPVPATLSSAELSLQFDYSRVDDADVAALLDGAFGVVFVGQAGDEFRAANAIADLTVTFRFVAE